MSLGCYRYAADPGTPNLTTESGPPGSISPPQVPGLDDLLIDALHPDETATGSYHRTSRVRLVVVNINPFLFNYRILTDPEPWVEASPSEFFQAILGGTVPGPRPLFDPAQPEPTSKGDPLGATLARCPAEVSSLATEYRVQVNALIAKSSLVASHEENLEKQIRDYEDSTEGARATMASINADARTVLASAHLNVEALAPALKAVTNSVSELPAQITALGQRAGALYTQVIAAQDKHPTCLSFTRLAGLLRELMADTLTLRANLKRLADWQSKADTSFSYMQHVIHDERQFYLTRRLEGFRQPQEIVVRVQRKYVGQDTTHYTNVFERRLDFGGPPRFTIGIGVAWTDLATRQYAARRQFTAPFQGRPADTVVTVIGVKEVSYNRVVPMLTLNTRLGGWNQRFVDGLHATLGATVRKDAGTVDPEFLFGGGISGLDERLMLVGGTYVGRTQRLTQGATLGSLLPPGESVPVESKIAWRPGIMISFKIK